jgi:transcriptional regulator of heat shock response
MKDTEHRSIWSYGLSRYCSEVMKENVELLNNICNGLVDTIKRQRNGEVVNDVALKDLIRMLLDLGLYSSHFEERFLNSTTEFYQTEGAERVSSMRIYDYLTYVETRLQEEQDRVEQYLHVSTREAVMKILHTELLIVHKERVIQEGAKQLFEVHHVHDMHRLYELVSRIEKKEELKVWF